MSSSAWRTFMTKNSDSAVVANESMFVLTTLEEIKETRLTFSQGSLTVS